MELETHWNEIKNSFETHLKSSKHCAVASVDNNGVPHITPIGFMFLRDPHNAYYFEQYSQTLPRNIETNNNVCLMTVNSGFMFWFTSLLKGRFASPPGVRLYGKAQARRKASADEIHALQQRIKSTRRFKGHRLLWQELQYVRDISLEGFEPVRYPVMMDHLWSNT